MLESFVMEVVMSQNNDMSQNKNIENEAVNEGKSTNLVVKKKRIKKSDILVFSVCLVASIMVWMYASNLQKAAQEKELNNDAIAGAVVDKIEEKESNKESNKESASENSTESTQSDSDSAENSK